MQFTKRILPVLVGVISAMILIALGEAILGMLYPLPASAGADNMAKAIAQMTSNEFMLLLVNYAICSFLAGIITSLVAKRTAAMPAIVVGIVLTIAGLCNVISFRQPLWFDVLNLVVYLPFVYAGYLAVRRKPDASGQKEAVI
jgi:hypothetical protein